MFRLLCAASLALAVTVCGAVVRAAALPDVSGAVALLTCGACGAAVIVDDRTGRRGPCRCGTSHTRPAAPAAGVAVASR